MAYKVQCKTHESRSTNLQLLNQHHSKNFKS